MSRGIIDYLFFLKGVTTKKKRNIITEKMNNSSRYPAERSVKPRSILFRHFFFFFFSFLLMWFVRRYRKMPKKRFICHRNRFFCYVVPVFLNIYIYIFNKNCIEKVSIDFSGCEVRSWVDYNFIEIIFCEVWFVYIFNLNYDFARE